MFELKACVLRAGGVVSSFEFIAVGENGGDGENVGRCGANSSKSERAKSVDDTDMRSECNRVVVER